MQFRSMLSVYRFAAVASLTCTLGNPGIASAEKVAPTQLSAKWVALGTPGSKRTVILEEGKSQPYVEVMPKSAFRLQADVLDAKGKVVAPNGTVFTQTQQRSDVRCEVKRRQGNQRFICLIDQDNDGKFESFTRLWLNSELFISGGPASVVGTPLRLPADLVEVDPRTEAEHFTIDLFFYNRAEFVQHNDIQICIVRGDLKSIWGSKNDLRICLPNRIYLGDGDYPHSRSLYGGSFTFVSREANRITVEIEPPHQDQVF